VIWHAAAITSPMLTSNAAGGTAGISGSGGSNGSGTSWNATNGGAGAVLSGLVTPSSTAPSSCSLPVSLLFFKAHRTGRYRVQLDWATALEKDNDYFTVEKSSDGINFYTLSTIDGNGNTSTVNNYEYSDQVSFQEIIYYRLLQTDNDGTRVNLGIQVVYPEEREDLVLTVYPNPFDDAFMVQWNGDSTIGFQQAYLSNAMGEIFLVPFHQEEGLLRFDAHHLKAGMYSLIIQHNNTLDYFKVVKH
jgi:hypothetical protein